METWYEVSINVVSSLGFVRIVCSYQLHSAVVIGGNVVVAILPPGVDVHLYFRTTPEREN